MGPLAVATGWMAAAGAQPVQGQDDPPLGRPAAIDLVSGQERVLVAAGVRLRRHPDLHSASVTMVDVAIELPILERLEGWILVRYGGRKGWLPVDDESSASLDSGGRRPEPESIAPDAARLELARGLLGDQSEVAALGTFALFTDSQDEELLRFLSRVADQVPVTYRDRYGLDPGATSREAIVLFSRMADYEAFAETVSTASGRGSPGLSGQGLAALSIGDRPPLDVAALLVHELTHLLNRRVMAARPRPWLEEGMANDMVFCRIDEAGRVRCDELGGSRVEIDHVLYRPGGWLGGDTEVRLEGPRASLSLIWERLRRGSLLPLADLLGLGWGEFSDPAVRIENYDASAFFVRYLEEGEARSLASGFRSFVLAVAAGGAAGPPQLEEHLGRAWPQIEAGFAAWLNAEASASAVD